MTTSTDLKTFKIAKGTKEQILIAYNNGDIGDTDFAIATDESYATTDYVESAISGKADKNLANSTAITNCITKIPQDIKLELNNGTITLKAGSKVYIPNGKSGSTNLFKEVIIQNDISTTNKGDVSLLFYHETNGGTILLDNIPRCVSGDTDSLSGVTYHTWYDTTNNLIKRFTTNTTPAYYTSLPVAVVTRDSSGVKSINQIFNGFGYIGSTVFALPNVKGLIPNGRHEDGSLKNIEFVNDRVRTFTATGSGYGLTYFLTQDTTSLAVINSKAYAEKDTKLTTFDGNGGVWFDTKQNIMLQTYDSGTTWTCVNYVSFSYMFMTNAGSLDYLVSKTPFHAVDYNDKSTISGWGMPSNRNIHLTLGASGSYYIAPANGYYYCYRSGGTSKYLSLENVNKGYGLQSNDGGNNSVLMLPISKGDTVKVNYNDGTTSTFLFIYAEGEQ